MNRTAKARGTSRPSGVPPTGDAGCSTCVRSWCFGSHALSPRGVRTRRPRPTPKERERAPPRHGPGVQSVHSVPLAPAGRTRRTATTRTPIRSHQAHQGAESSNGRDAPIASPRRSRRRTRLAPTRRRLGCGRAQTTVCRATRRRAVSQPHRIRRPLHASICTERLRRVAKPFTQPDRMARTAPRLPTRRQKRSEPLIQASRNTTQQMRPPSPETQSHALPRAPSLSLS